MDAKIKVIIERTENSIEDLCHVVQEYIFAKKQRRVVINVNDLQVPPTHFAYSVMFERQLQMLDQAFYCAKKWFYSQEPNAHQN